MPRLAVDVVDVSKQFRLFDAKYQSVKERLLHPGRNPYKEFWALHHVAFQVSEGETIGILGRNGSGKSTLLKCVSGILKPTEGKVVVRGQLAALLELGAGFQPELSGRDNIYLNGSLLGLSRREMEKRFDQIVAFAELEHFIDNQVKFYSSGMFVRLGFAVAVNVDPDILVVDEVLAVGDENFQRKCLARIKEFQEEGRTILFVTHSSDLVRQICDRAVVLSAGDMIAEGPAPEAVRAYQQHLVEVGSEADVPAGSPDAGQVLQAYRPIRVSSIEVDHPGEGSRPYLITGEPLIVHVDFSASEPVDDVVVAVEVRDAVGMLIYASDTSIVDEPFSASTGTGRIRLMFDQVPLLGGSYTMSVSIRSREGLVYDLGPEQRFEVMNPGRSRGSVDLDLRAEIEAVG
ncbi:MAG: polysaccharide ABC transporter ATP-binding protein [Acidimicrobiales bacterium]